MQWTGPQLKQLEDALLSAFPDESALRRMVRFDLNEQLSQIAGGDSLDDVVFSLIQWAEANGRLEDLIKAARTANPGNPTLQQLEQQIRRMIAGDTAAPESMAPLTWPALCAQAKTQNGRFLVELQGKPTRPETFIPDVYTRRTTVEQQLAAFLTSNDSALILTGESGVGKTTLLCQWIMDLTATGHAVFFYDCGGSLNVEIEREIAQDLGLDSAGTLFKLLAQLSGIAPEGQRLVLVFDAVDQFEGSATEGSAALLKNIDALVGRLSGGMVRVVLGCTSPAWRRFERLGVADLFWRRYYPSDTERPMLLLDSFTAEELAIAYAAYQRFFHLRTSLRALPATLRESLALPLLLRMLAEAYKDQPGAQIEADLPLTIYKTYYENRAKRWADQLFATDLVGEMRRQGRSVLAIEDLIRDNRFNAVLVNDTESSAYYRLLENGILSEIHMDPAGDNFVRFTYARLGAYILARDLARQTDAVDKTVAALLDEAPQFSLAWDAARMLLLLRKDASVFAQLAASTDIEVRELVVESLVELYAGEGPRALELIKTLLIQDSEEARRTGLKAAHAIGSGARDLFLWAAREGPPTLREATRNTLYLIWRSDPAFTYGLLHDLIAQIGLLDLLGSQAQKVLEFVIELSVIIYMNHPEQPEVVKQTVDLYYDLATVRLHLDHPILAAAVTVFSGAIAKALITPTLSAILLEELQPAQNIFNLSPAARAPLKTIVAPLLDPRVDLVPALPKLAPLLDFEVLFFNVVAAHVIPIHAYRQFATLDAPLRSLYDQLGPQGRLWLLFSFSLLTPDTPPEWIPLLETFTQRLIEEHPAVFYDDSLGLLSTFDALLLPLGLAYGKRNQGMPYFEMLISANLARGDMKALGRCLAGLGAVGFYYPDVVFQMLRKAIPDFQAPAIQEALLPLLATMRTLHFDAVDNFQRQVGLDALYTRQVAAAADVSLLRRYIAWIGLYNEVVYRCLFYPVMRQRLSIEVLEALADTPSEDAFVALYTRNIVHMFQEANYRLSEWFKPDPVATVPLPG